MLTLSDGPVRVMLIASPIHAWGLQRLIEGAQPTINLAASVQDTPQALMRLETGDLDVVLAASEQTSLEELRALSARTPAKVLLLTNSRDLTWHDRAVMEGVRGVVTTRDSPAALLKAIERVHQGELWIDRSATTRIFMEMARRAEQTAQQRDPDQAKIATLTLREREMIVAVTQDATARGKVIAGRLCISEHTLRNHLNSIYAKLGLTNRLDLYAFALRHNLTHLNSYAGDRS